MNILIVDDLPDQTASLAELLRIYGHEVRAASGGEEAMAICESFWPDAVLTDLSMPHIDGFRLASMLRSGLPGRPFWVSISGHPNMDKRSREAGFDRHFLKPVAPENLLAVLDRCEQSLRRTARAG